MAKEYTAEDVKAGKAFGMKVKDQLELVKKSLKNEPDPIAFTDEFEDRLIEKLFEEEVKEAQKEEKDKLYNPDFERAGYVPKVEKKPGL